MVRVLKCVTGRDQAITVRILKKTGVDSRVGQMNKKKMTVHPQWKKTKTKS